MDTIVGHLCRPVVSVDMDATVQDVLENADWNKVSSVVVLDQDKNVVGIISEKDMVYAESLGIKKKDLKAWQICSKNIVKISPEDSTAGAARLMVDHKVHHVLVMTGDYVEGVVSTMDVLKQFIDTKNSR
jgi:signal-transduction protein with cAMP-binding, CBS, and nucleotidyltransferase domain